MIDPPFEDAVDGRRPVGPIASRRPEHESNPGVVARAKRLLRIEISVCLSSLAVGIPTDAGAADDLGPVGSNGSPRSRSHRPAPKSPNSGSQ